MAESAPSAKGPFRQILTLIGLVLTVLYLGKIYLRDPDYRHVEVCYLPYKIAHLVWVDAWGAIVTDDAATHLKHSRDLADMFHACTTHVSQQTWLRTLGTNQ
jgi:hypothetical protein